MDPLDCTLDELCNENDRKRKRNNRFNHYNDKNYNRDNHYSSSLKRFKKNNHNHRNHRNYNYNYNHNNYHRNRNMSRRNKNYNYNSKHNSKCALSTLPSAPSSNYYTKLNEEKEKKKAKREYGYVTLVMRGDNYVPGALILAHSLRLVHTQCSLIVMVTNDVSERARQALQLLYHYVVEVPYIKYTGKCQRMKTDKQQQKYKEWASDSFTKWNVLQLNHLLKVQFEKLLFLDSDKIAMQNIDHLFTDANLKCPAGTFSSPWTSNGPNRNGLRDYYPKHLSHGDEIPATAIYNALYKNGFVAVGTSMLFKPNTNHFKKLIQMLDDKWISDEYLANNMDKEKCNAPHHDDTKAKRMIGFKNCYSMLDEQSIVFFYFYHKVAWNHMDTKYNFIPWHFKWLQNEEGTLEIPLILHFFGMKPWKLSPLEWRDLQAWWALVSNLVHYGATTYKWNETQQSLIASFFTLSLMEQLPCDLSADSAERRNVTCFWCYELAKRQGLRPAERIKRNECDAIEWIFHYPIDPVSGTLCCPKLQM